jgi:hypothetical protein
MSQHNFNQSSTSVTVRLAADGRNWKDSIKQMTNAAAADNAFTILDGKSCPDYDSTLPKYRLQNLIQPDQEKLSPDFIEEELHRIGKLNKSLRAINDDARQLKKEDEQAANQWIARDTRLQNTILSSVDKALLPQIRNSSTAHSMYLVLKELNNSSDYANPATAWQNFIDLRADTCKTVRDYIGRFRETVNDITQQGITIDWKKKSIIKTTETGVEELMVIHLLHGLSKVLPQWVEARNNDLRQGNTWSIDTLTASVEDHLCNTPEEPVKTFATVIKQAEEKRALARINNRHPSPQQQKGKPPAPLNSHKTKTWVLCKHCNREHPGANEKCYIAHPELRPSTSKQYPLKQKPTNKPNTATTNVTIASQNDDNFSSHVYTSIVSFVSPTLLSKAVKNNDYKQRFCYDTAANRHVFNDRSNFVTYTDISHNDVHGSTGSTVAYGIGMVRIEIVKSDSTTDQIRLAEVLHCPDFATNVISQAPFKRKGV